MAYIKKMVMTGFKSFARKTEIIFDEGINVIVGPNGSGKSCSYDTIVTLANGEEIELGKLVEEQIEKSEDIKKLDDGIYVNGDGSIEIISLNKTTMKSENKFVSKFIRRNGEELYKIRTRTGKELKATGCHPVMSFVDGEVKSRLIRDMKKGSLVATPRILNAIGGKSDERLSRLIGYIIGDGYIAKNRIEFVNKDPELLEDFTKIMENLFNHRVKSRKEKGVERIFIYGKKIVNEIRNYFGEFEGSITSEKKKIPNFILCSDNKTSSNVLAGLFDTDGSVRKDIAVIEFCTKNKNLARQVQGLLLRFGIISKIKKRKCRATNTEKKIEREYYYVYIYGLENINKFYTSIPLRCRHKVENIIRHLDRKMIPNPNVDILPKEVNMYVKELAQLLGIQIKPLRKEYPSFMAYVDNRCLPTRNGISSILNIFQKKLIILNSLYQSIKKEQLNLVQCMDEFNLSSQFVSKEIGLHSTAIRNQWATQMFNPRPQNLENFYNYIKNVFIVRLPRIKELMVLLTNLANSDIFWDEIISIEKLDKEKYVYDLTIEENHNFVANNIFAHNSNIIDALCFVLGRLSIKSMRAAKVRNMIFMGSKFAKPAHEASVEIVFDNSDKKFVLDTSEISIKRIVRTNGQGIYKLNGETKTRTEIIEILAHAGIDPYGFNLILQGEIQSIVKMHPEERRKIIEEVAGISIYESRKEKSLNELEKTDARLKEIGTILRERTAYLNNLEKEKAQAQRHKELQTMGKRLRASIIKKRLDDKVKEIENIEKTINEKSIQCNKLKEKVEKSQKEIDRLSEKIQQINKYIQKASGVEQGALRDEITELRAGLEGLRARKEGFEHRKEETEKRIFELAKQIPELESEVAGLRKQMPGLARKAQELKKKKEELAELEKERRKILTLKSSLESFRERIEDRQRQLGRVNSDSENLVKQIEEITRELNYSNSTECLEALKKLKNFLTGTKEEVIELRKKEMEDEKIISVAENEIKRNREIREKVEKIDVCPLCQSKMTESHIMHVFKDCDGKISDFGKKLEEVGKELKEIREKRTKLVKEIEETEKKIYSCQKELNIFRTVDEKKDLMKKSVEYEKILKTEIKELNEKRAGLEGKTSDLSLIEEKYQEKILEIEEISSRTEEDVDTTLLYKEREIEKTRNIVSRAKEDLEEIKEQIKEFSDDIETKEEALEEHELKEEELEKRFKRMYIERDNMQTQIQEENIGLTKLQSEARQIEEQVNYLKIGRAKFDGERQTIEIDMEDYHEVEIIQGSLNYLEERLEKTQEALDNIGSINMRALEVYDEIKKEYDIVRGKVETLESEKGEIMKIIDEIDKKKYRAFMKTFKAINDLFKRNFSKLYSKGAAYLEVENKEDIFAGGVNIVVKLAKGKYFDINSLSGGEKTLVALALLFAIQEFKPYQFYVLDEIDAALDKRNSERLVALLNQYMKSGQYIVISHNDAIILNSQLLYGISMHEGVSKILSLHLGESGNSTEKR